MSQALEAGVELGLDEMLSMAAAQMRSHARSNQLDASATVVDDALLVRCARGVQCIPVGCIDDVQAVGRMASIGRGLNLPFESRDRAREFARSVVNALVGGGR